MPSLVAKLGLPAHSEPCTYETALRTGVNRARSASAREPLDGTVWHERTPLLCSL